MIRTRVKKKGLAPFPAFSCTLLSPLANIRFLYVYIHSNYASELRNIHYKIKNMCILLAIFWDLMNILVYLPS